MALMISKNGYIQDYSHQNHPQLKRVKKRDEHNGQAKKQPHSGEIQSYKKNSGQAVDHEFHRLHITARDIGSSPLIIMRPDQNIGDALSLMEKHHIHHVVILDELNKIAGIVSDRDCLAHRTIMNIMNVANKEVVICKFSTDVKILANLLLENKISSVPYLSEKNEVEGIVTKTDILRAVIQHFPFETRA